MLTKVVKGQISPHANSGIKIHRAASGYVHIAFPNDVLDSAGIGKRAHIYVDSANHAIKIISTEDADGFTLSKNGNMTQRIHLKQIDGWPRPSTRPLRHALSDGEILIQDKDLG